MTKDAISCHNEAPASLIHSVITIHSLGTGGPGQSNAMQRGNCGYSSHKDYNEQVNYNLRTGGAEGVGIITIYFIRFQCNIHNFKNIILKENVVDYVS